jgi:Tfp pilus assembly protein PilF
LKGTGEMASSLFNNMPVFIQYIGKVLFPFNLSVMPVMQDTGYIFGVVAIILLAAAVFISKGKRNNRILFGVVWFAVFLLPTLITTSAFRIHQPYEHRMYLPMVGVLFFLSEIDPIKNFTTQKMSFRIVSVFIILSLFTLTFLHEKTFTDTKTFLDNAVSTSPGSSLAHRNMGIYYQDKNLLKEASEEYLKALALNPHEKDLHNNLGVIYDSWHKRDLAEKEYLTETRLNPENAQAFHNLGVICAERNENEKAEKYFKQALSVRQNKGTFEQLALLYQKMNRKEDFDKIVRILRSSEKGTGNLQAADSPNVPNQTIGQPGHPLPTDAIALGRQLMQEGKSQEAEIIFKQALKKDSMNKQAYFNLGLICYSAKQLGDAEILWRKAVLIDPTYVDAFNNLAICLAQQGKNAEAEVVLKKIISSNPDYLDGYFNLANFYARTGNADKALVYVKELKKRGISKEQFVQRGIKLSEELEKVFDK